MTPKQVVKPNEMKAAQPQPQAPTPAPVAATPNRQTMKLEELKTAWTKKGVDLSKLIVTPDGKFLMVLVDGEWPVVKIGPTGGIDIPALKSYPKAWDAALDAKELLKKQTERAAKKTAAAAPAPTTPKPPAPGKPVAGHPEQPKETPAVRKQKADQQLEQRLSA